MKFYCIADGETAQGFRLAGIITRTAATQEEAMAAIDELTSQSDCGIIVVTDKVADWVQPHIETIRMERDRPLIVEIPGPEGPVPGRRSLRELVQEAVGVSVG